MKPVLFSVSYAGFWGQARLSLEEFIPHARKLGYAGVELAGKRPHLSPLDWDDRAKLIKLRNLCDRHRLEVSCVAAYTNFSPDPKAAEVPLIDMQVQYVESLARMAKGLGCKLVRVFTAYERDDVPIGTAWNTVVAAIQQCCDRAAEHGVTIGIQNHHDVAVHSKALVELRGDVNRANCKLMLDPWSPCLRGEPAFDTARKLAKLTCYTTIADYLRLPRARYQPDLVNYAPVGPALARAVPVGEGDIGTLDFVRGLKAGGFDGPIAYEMCSPVRGGGSIENLDRCARRFIAWLDENGFR
ncbi:MAG: sugar phosphate isomerase/epimerase [Verrucomicrobia bacterium]|nr:sugar phosphate isomerase/epimerase [Verrucomicrobiota bacterium]